MKTKPAKTTQKIVIKRRERGKKFCDAIQLKRLTRVIYECSRAWTGVCLMWATVPANTISKVIDQSKALEDIIYVRVGLCRHKTERTLISI